MGASLAVALLVYHWFSPCLGSVSSSCVLRRRTCSAPILVLCRMRLQPLHLQSLNLQSKCDPDVEIRSIRLKEQKQNDLTSLIKILNPVLRNRHPLRWPICHHLLTVCYKKLLHLVAVVILAQMSQISQK